MASNKSKLVMRILPMVIAAAYTGGAFAQAAIEEVVVTAQKRKEKLQDVPLSISAISSAQLEARGIEGARDLNALAPNVTIKVAPGAGLTAVGSIRGMTQGQPAIWADPSIGMYVDGVFVGKNQGALFDVVDMERIEILRGPQGTLFGRNTEGGAINMITHKPSGEFTGSVGVDFGNFNRRVERVAVDLPKMGILRLGVAVRDEKRDGVTDNPNGAKWDSRDRLATRLTAGVDISSDFKIDYAYDHTNIDETPMALSLIDSTGYAKLYTSPAVAGTYAYFQSAFGPGSLGKLLAPLANANYATSVTGNPNTQYYNRLKVDGNAVTASYALNANNTVKYIGAKRKMVYADRTDLDGTALNIFNAGKDTEYETTSHELQLIGNTPSMNYVVGAFMFKEDGYTKTFQSGSFYTFSAAAVQYKQPYYRVRSDAKAVFGQLDYKLSQDLTATLGIRRTTEDKNGDLWRTNTNANFDAPGSAGVTYQAGYTPQGAAASFSSTTPVVALAYKIDSNLNVYGRIAQGFKSGGFPLEAVTNAATSTGPLVPFKPETSTSYEAGFKSTLLGGKATLNAAIFRTNIKDWQTSVLPPGGTTPTITNAGVVQNQGFELEGAVQIADGWRMQGSYGYLDSKYKTFMSFNQFNAAVDIANNTNVGYVPKQQFSFSVDGRIAQTSMGNLRAIVDYVYASEYYNYAGQMSAAVTNAAIGNSSAESLMPSLGYVNARLLLSNIPLGSGSASASLWVRNLGNEQKQITHIDVGGYYRIAAWSEPRTFGLALNYKW